MILPALAIPAKPLTRILQRLARQRGDGGGGGGGVRIQSLSLDHSISIYYFNIPRDISPKTPLDLLTNPAVTETYRTILQRVPSHPSLEYTGSTGTLLHAAATGAASVASTSPPHLWRSRSPVHGCLGFHVSPLITTQSVAYLSQAVRAKPLLNQPKTLCWWYQRTIISSAHISPF